MLFLFLYLQTSKKNRDGFDTNPDNVNIYANIVVFLTKYNFLIKKPVKYFYYFTGKYYFYLKNFNKYKILYKNIVIYYKLTCAPIHIVPPKGLVVL